MCAWNRCMEKEDVVYIHNGILLSHKKNEILPVAATLMDLENIMLREVSRRKTNTVWYHVYVESKKSYKQMYIAEQKQTQIQKAN